MPEEINQLKLDNQLCFLLYAGSRAITKRYRPLLDRIGLTYPQYLVMLVLWERDNIPVKTIAEKLFLDTGTLTPLLKRLELSGFISRNRTGSDERNVIITLTDSGKNLKEAARSVPAELIRGTDITPAEFTGFRDTLRHLFTRLAKE